MLSRTTVLHPGPAHLQAFALASSSCFPLTTQILTLVSCHLLQEAFSSCWHLKGMPLPQTFLNCSLVELVLLVLVSKYLTETSTPARWGLTVPSMGHPWGLNASPRPP